MNQTIDQNYDSWYDKRVGTNESQEITIIIQ